MATAAGLILSAFGAGLSLVGQIQDSLSSKDPHGTKLEFACAQISPENESDSVSGRFDVRLFNAYAERVGPPVVDKYINRGNVALDFTYDQPGQYAGNQAPYIKITGNNDAVCLSWFTVTWPGGLDWAWTGDHGKQCGILPWHYNAAQFGIKHNGDGSQQTFRPSCSWIDGDGSVGGDTTAYSVYLPHFTTENDGSHQTRNSLCNGPNFVTYQNDDSAGLSYFSPPPAINNRHNYDGRKRSAFPDDAITTSVTEANSTAISPDSIVANKPITERLFTKKNIKLIQSAFEEHSAVELCESDSSWGPSFVSDFEGKFCDMSTKTVYHVCDSNSGVLDALCFDTDKRALRGLKSLITFDWQKFEKWDDNMEPMERISL